MSSIMIKSKTNTLINQDYDRRIQTPHFMKLKWKMFMKILAWIKKTLILVIILVNLNTMMIQTLFALHFKNMQLYLKLQQEIKKVHPA